MLFKSTGNALKCLTLNVINNNILLIHLNVTQVLIELTVQYILVYINAFQYIQKFNLF